jgi:hypothetical protein
MWRTGILAGVCVAAIGCGQNSMAPTSADAGAARASAVTAAAALPSRAASADKSIRIVQGEFVFPDNSHGTASLQGTEGFRFSPTIGDGSFPGSQCIMSTDCRPGATVTLHGEWAGSDLVGTAVWRGKSYPGIGLNSGSFIRLSGQFVAPPQADKLTIKVPFQLTGFVQVEEQGQVLNLEGAGTATLQLLWDTTLDVGGPGTWTIISSRYDFGGAR